MAYDADLADRIRAAVAEQLPEGVLATERGMFGGHAFLVHGHLAAAASGQGGVLLRCAPSDTERLVAEPGVARMEMRGRAMDGWLRVSDDAVETDESLREWVAVGLDHVLGLPPKETGDRRR
ncbi:MAG TPA: TfoX/Sxy family protein [Dermatophilaceae bacterium]|nr:TfoX/Sxy family protein [Dermatophilaceae bacterium]